MIPRLPSVPPTAATKRRSGRRSWLVWTATWVAVLAVVAPPARAADEASPTEADPVATAIADRVAARAAKPSVHEAWPAVREALAAAGVSPDTIAALPAAVARADLPGMAGSLDAFLFLTREPRWLAIRGHFAEFLDLPGVTRLDPDRVRPLVDYAGVVTLPDLDTLSPESAAALAEFGRDDWGAAVEFPAVAELAPDAAAALARCEALLVLPRLARLSAESARALAEHQGIGIVLGGLDSLPADVAAALAETRSMQGLLLPDLAVLDSPALARRLARQDHVFLPRVAAIEPEIAAALRDNEGGELALPGLRELPPEAARQLVGGGYYWLRLGGADRLTPAAAAILAEHAGQLTFTGPTPFSPAAAARLAGQANVLSLPHVAELPADVAAALAPHRGPLLLAGVDDLSPAAAAALAAHAGGLHLPGLVELSPAAARALAPHRGRLALEGLTDLPDELATALAGHAGALALDAVTSLTPAAARALAAAPGDLSLAGLVSLDPEAAAALAGRRQRTELPGLAQVERIDSLPLAHLLVACFDDLSLDRLTSLEGPQATAIARVLAGTRGMLALPALHRTTPQAVEALLAKRDVELPPLESLELVAEPAAGGDDVVDPRR